MARGTKKPGLTMERHKEVGLELYRLHERLCILLVEVGQAYPLTGRRGKQMRELSRMDHALMRLRSEMEDRMFEQYPDLPDKQGLRVYYPGTGL